MMFVVLKSISRPQIVLKDKSKCGEIKIEVHFHSTIGQSIRPMVYLLRSNGLPAYLRA